MEQINNVSDHKINKLNANVGLIGRLKKTRLYKVLTLPIAAASIAAVMLFTTGCAEIDLETNIEYIIEYYGEDSKESEVIDYIEISRLLNDLNLDEYTADDSLYEKFNVSSELKSVDEINIMINNFTESYTGSSKNLTEQSKYVENILNLKVQEDLVNRYIYNTGYSVANDAISIATKKYVGEVFGISDYENITFRYNEGHDETIIVIYNNGEKSYVIDRNTLDGQKNQIFDGVLWMTKTNTHYDKNDKDNYSYNEDRNDYILKALEESAKINNEVNDKDLYDSDLASDMKKR